MEQILMSLVVHTHLLMSSKWSVLGFYDCVSPGRQEIKMMKRASIMIHGRFLINGSKILSEQALAEFISVE
jgi:hypothetical protein